MRRRSVRCPLAAVLAAALAVLPGSARAQDAEAEPPARGVTTTELSPQVEMAISKALRHLAKTQNPDGSWGKTYKGAETALALMAFMVKGNFPNRGVYGATVDKAVAFLILRGAAKNGFLGSQQQGMYEHGLATLALSEVWGESDRAEVKQTLKKAVEVIMRSQDGSGGWRYSPQPSGADISATVMQVVALASAKEAGILVPDSVLYRAIRYVKRCQHVGVGGFAYQPGGIPGFARTAAGVMSLMMSGQRDSKAVERGLAYLVKYPASKFANVQWYYYAHYYAVQCMYQAGDAYYQKWYPRIRDALLARQDLQGHWGGGSSGTSPAFNTALAVLILGVPYRFLPIYQR